MLAGTFHVPSAIQKPLVFVATTHASVPATLLGQELRWISFGIQLS